MRITSLSLCLALGAGHFVRVEWGNRPEYLIDDMEDSELKTMLNDCLNSADIQPSASDFSIGHRGACLQFPEHTLQSYQAAIYQGAGLVECDVAVTADGELVCRHSQCDLHTTTNILVTDLASKCSEPFAPADEEAGTEASAMCCTSDITLEEFKTLCGKMDAYDPTATTAEEFLGGTPEFRTDLYATCGTLLSHSESISLIWGNHRKFTPELKTYTQGDIAESYDEIREKLIQEYIDAGVDAVYVWPQSFNKPDIDYWIENYPETFGPQAVYLDEMYCDGTLEMCPQTQNFTAWKEEGINYYAPPTQMLITVENGTYAPSELAMAATDAGLSLITWTLERSGPLSTGGGWYYETSTDVTNNDGDTFEYLHVLAQDVGVVGVFSDWPATTTFYANCMEGPPDSPSWHKNGEPDKNCDWVSDFSEMRCMVKAEDKTLAMEACLGACAGFRRRLAEE